MTSATLFIKEGGPHEKSIGEFLLNWLDERDFVLTSSSGSTGGPKLMPLSKQSMVNSAIATGDALNLEAGQTCLLCLPATHIAGKNDVGQSYDLRIRIALCVTK